MIDAAWQVTGSGSKYFGYCSTLAIYVYDIETMTLKRMIAGHSKPITAFGWSPHAAISNYIVTATYGTSLPCHNTTLVA